MVRADELDERRATLGVLVEGALERRDDLGRLRDVLDINRSYETRCAVIGDARLTLQALSEELSKRTGGARKNPTLVAEIRAARQEFMAKFKPWLESSETPINPYRVLGDLMKVLDPKHSFVTADSGNTRDQTSTVYEAHIPRGFLG